MTKPLPAEASMRYLLDAVTALWSKPRDRSIPDPTLYAYLERQTAIAVTRDRTGQNIRDGYPTNTLAGWGGANNGSSVETHALAHPQRDLHHDYTLRAIEGIEGIVVGVHIWIDALRALEALISDRGPTPRTCAACTGHRPLGGDQTVAHRGTVGNRLERDTDLCQPCWDFVRQTADAGTHQGSLPTIDQIAWHDNHGRWRLRIAG